MATSLHAFHQAQLQRDGANLNRLAILGEGLLVLGILGAPLALYAIALPIDPALDFRSFLKDMYVSGPAALLNLYGLIKSGAILLMLDSVRRLGQALSGNEPLGSNTLKQLKWLTCVVAVYALMTCFGVDLKPDSTMQPANFKTDWTVSFTPLFLGGLALLGLSIVRRIVSQALILETEAKEFV